MRVRCDSVSDSQRFCKDDFRLLEVLSLEIDGPQPPFAGGVCWGWCGPNHVLSSILEFAELEIAPTEVPENRQFCWTTARARFKSLICQKATGPSSFQIRLAYKVARRSRSFSFGLLEVLGLGDECNCSERSQELWGWDAMDHRRRPGPRPRRARRSPMTSQPQTGQALTSSGSRATSMTTGPPGWATSPSPGTTTAPRR